MFFVSLVVWIVCLAFPDFYLFTSRVYPSLIAALAGTLVCVKVSMIIARYVPGLKRFLLFMGINSLTVFYLHTIEGNYIYWKSYPLLSTFDHVNLLIFFFRMTLICLMMWLFVMSPIKRSNSSPTVWGKRD